MSSNPSPENSSSRENSEFEPSSAPPVSADELLPPVEPPSGGFIIQLFVIPAIIVMIVVLLGTLFTSLATQGDQDPTKIVAALRGSSHARWQKAEELANMLRLEKRYPELKQNTDLAGQLAQLLSEEVDAAADDKNSVNLRYYLCRVLGEFHVDTGLGVLLKTAREDADRDVRREAINALGVLSHGLRELDPPQTLDHPEYVSTIVAVANDQDDLIRSQTAFALGVFTLASDADPALLSELEKLVDDLYSDARYNAALGLARQGNLKALGAVIEMFDPEALTLNTAREESPQMQVFKRDTIVSNALQAASHLHEANPSADLSQLRAAIQQYVDTGAKWQPQRAPDSLLKRARELLAKMNGSQGTGPE